MSYTLNKTAGGTLLACQAVAASSVVVGSAVDLSTKMGALVFVRFGRRSATAAGAACNVRVELSSLSALDNSWFPLATLSSTFAACEAEAVSGVVAAGATVITVASTTNLAAGDVIVLDNGASSEWCRIKSIVAATSVTVEDALVTAATGLTMYDSAEIFAPVYVPEGSYRVRVVADGSLFTQAFLVEARYVSLDSIG